MASGADEAGFWPVTRLRSTTTCGTHGSPTWTSTPASVRRSSSSHFALSAKPAWVSSAFVNAATL